MSDRPARPRDGNPFDAHTLERKALQADVLARMFGEVEPELVQAVGRYEILRKIGAGGMGEVYLGRDPELDRKVAIKLLRRYDEEEFSDDAEQRLRQEARAMARVSHAHVVHVHDVGRFGEQLFLAMEYVDGSTLTRWLEQARSTAEIVRVFIEAGDGLAAAHDAELVHRDFKPDNVLVGSDGVVKVTDFGIALVMESWQTRASLNEENTGEQGYTIAGTLRYMSPEQVRGQPLDARSDQFSYCVALYEALTGRHPFSHDQGGELIRELLAGERRPLPRGHGIPAWLLGAVERGISRRPEDRWPSMRALLQVLGNDPSRGRWRWTLGGTLALGVGLAAFAVGRAMVPTPDDPCAEGSRQVESAWGEAQRQAVAAQFGAHALSYGEGSLQATLGPLDAWSGSWSDAYAGLCRSRHERSIDNHEQRMACLTEQRQRVAARVDLLTQANTRLVSEAPRLIEELPEASECADVSLELAPPPPEASREVAAIRERLASLEAELSFGQRDDGMQAELGQLRERADALGYVPLVAEVAWVQSIEAEHADDDPRAHELVALVYGLGLETRHDRLALRAAIRMQGYDVPIERSRDAEHARELWNATARHLSVRLGSPLHQELGRRAIYSERLRSHGHHDRVAAELEETLALLEATVGLDHPDAIAAQLGQAYGLLGNNELVAALAVLDRVDAIFEMWVGADHPLAAKALEIRCDVLFVMGRYGEALLVAQRLLELLAAQPETEPRVLGALERIASIEDTLGHHAEAREVYERLLGGPSPRAASIDIDHIATANSLCFVLYELREYASAVDVCEQTLAAARRAWPEGSAMEAIVLNNLALIARDEGRLEDGLRIDEQALALCESLDPPQLRATVYSWIGVGESLLALGRPAEALEPLTQALELRGSAAEGSAEHGEAQCLLAQARAAAEPEQHAAALVLGRQGLERLEAAGPGWSRQIEACRAWIDEVERSEPGAGG